MDALNNLKKILSGKWDFVTMQAEEQVNNRITYNVSGLLATYLDLLATHRGSLATLSGT